MLNNTLPISTFFSLANDFAFVKRTFHFFHQFFIFLSIFPPLNPPLTNTIRKTVYQISRRRFPIEKLGFLFDE